MRIIPINTTLANPQPSFQQGGQLAVVGILARALRCAVFRAHKSQAKTIKWNQLVVWDVECKLTPQLFSLADDQVLDLYDTKIESSVALFWNSSKAKPNAVPVLVNLNGSLWYVDDGALTDPLPAVLTGLTTTD